MADTSYPDFITALPQAQIPFDGVRGWISQADSHQVVFMDIEPIGAVSPHSHGEQWGIVVEGALELTIGDEMQVGYYSLKLSGFNEGETPNYQYGRVTVEAYKNGRLVRTMKPEKRIYKTGQQQSTTTVALYSTPKEDLYLIFAGISDDGSKYEITARVNPLVFWIWFGAAVMVLGAVITLLPNRPSAVIRRAPSQKEI